MKRSVKKIILSSILVGTLIVPTVAQAAHSYCSGGSTRVRSNYYYEWADYDSHLVYGKLVTNKGNKHAVTNWQHTTTKTLYGVPTYVSTYYSY